MYSFVSNQIKSNLYSFDCFNSRFLYVFILKVKNAAYKAFKSLQTINNVPS